MKNPLFVTALLACSMSAFPARSAEEASFRVEKTESDGACLVVAINKSFAPITIAAKINGGAYQSDRKWPVQKVIAPNSTREIARIRTEENRGSCQVDISYTHSVGNAFSVPDRHYRYRLPFRKGSVVRVTQEPNGVLTTHRDALNRYAVDFDVSRGTPVFAARAGTAIEIRNTFDEGRLDPKLAEKVNLVSIIHADGTFAQYSHLAPQSVVVRPGERVETGQMLGRSGSTGFAGGPHLHFDLRRARIGTDGIVRQESLPFDFFRQGSGKKITMKQRKLITVD